MGQPCQSAQRTAKQVGNKPLKNPPESGDARVELAAPGDQCPLVLGFEVDFAQVVFDR